ncbi:MAG: membrane protein insertase YidC [Kangiellaceae bacterium]|jgi:YidC/Oxa1 family membrane protein insertase
MESARTFLFILFAFLTFLLYQEWQKDHAPVKVEKAPIESSIESSSPVVSDELNNLPASNEESSAESDDLSSQVPEQVAQKQLSQTDSVKPIIVETDLLRVMITPAGGNLLSAELIKYKESLDKDAQPINILENRNGRVFQALSGLFGENAPDFKNNVAIYQTSETQYKLSKGQENLQVDLIWTNANGVNYIKRFTFHRDQYLIDVEFIVNNQSEVKIANRMFTALKRDTGPVDGQETTGLGMQSFIGPAFSTDQEKYQKYDFEDLQEADLNIKTKDGWVAILQHYFVTAWVPVSDKTNIIDTAEVSLGNEELAQIRITQDWKWVEPGNTETFSAKLYVGPKIQSELEQIAEGLDLTIDYGWLWWIGQPIFYMLIFFQSFVINWGLAIILVTIAIKTLLYPLARAQYRSFAKMRLLQPKMTAMKEQYGDDRQKMSMKMMELYKKEKVNPLGGCFPLLIQMPVFIALYWVLMESVELRHAPFMLWIDDLSVMDPYYVLPLLMGASMYLMQKMQPMSPTMDPMQQKMMQMMPVFMTVFFVFFPAGLVLYWLMNNLISIAQQLYITKQFNNEQEAKKKK